MERKGSGMASVVAVACSRTTASLKMKQSIPQENHLYLNLKSPGHKDLTLMILSLISPLPFS